MIFSISEALGFNIVLIVFAIINIAIRKNGKKTFIPLIIGALFTAVALFGGVKQDIYRTGKYVLSNQRVTEIVVAIIIITVTVIICLIAKNKASRNIGQQSSSKSTMAEGSNVNETAGTYMFCRKCGTKIPADSEFCKQCGEKIEFVDWGSAENSSKTEVYSSAGINYTHNNSADNQQVYSYQRYDSETKEESDTSKKTSKIITYTILLITAFLVGITVYFGMNESTVVSSTPMPNIPAETPHILPSTGSVFVGGDKIRGSEITIDCSNCSQSVYIKLKTSGGATAFAFFVRAGTTVTVKVPKGLYQVYFAQGTDWYGVDKLFGENTHYSKDNEFIDTSYKWTYTMYPVSNGNFSQTPINSNDF